MSTTHHIAICAFSALCTALLTLQPSSPADQQSAPIAKHATITEHKHTHGNYVKYLPTGHPKEILVIVHGTLGKDLGGVDLARAFIKRWTDQADRRGLLLIAPAFDQHNFGGHAGPGGGYRGLFGRNVGADQFLNEILDETRQEFPDLPENFYLYGHSAGGQFVSRYLVRHPDRIKAAVISAAGTFAFPDPDVPWTNGMKRLQRSMKWGTDSDQQIDIQPDPQGWIKAAQLPVTVVVGALDKEQIKASPGQVGNTHVARARHWTRAMNNHARQNDKRGSVRCVVVEGIGHNSNLLTPTCMQAFWPN